MKKLFLGMFAFMACSAVFANIDGQTFVIQQVKDNAGNILSTTNFISPVSVSETKANIRVETIKQGGVFTENTAE